MPDTASFTLNVNSREGVAALEAFAKAAEKAAKAGKDSEDQAKKTGAGMSMLGAGLAGGIAGAGANIIADMGRSALQGAKDFTKASFEIAVSRESIQASFKSLLGSAEMADRAMGMIRKAASKPGLTFDTALTATQRALGAGFNLDTAVKVVELFGNASALAGLRADEMGEAMRGFFQIIARGKAEQEDLNQILDRIPQLAQPIIKEFGGRTSEAINKVAKSSDDMAQRFIRALSGMAKAPDLTANALLNLKNEVDDVKAQFGKGLIGDESVKQTNKLAAAIKELGPIAKDIGTKVGQWLTWGINQAVDAWHGWQTVMGNASLANAQNAWTYSMPGMAGLSGAVPSIAAPARAVTTGDIVAGLTGGIDPFSLAFPKSGTGLSTRPLNPNNAAEVKSTQQLADERARQIKEARADYIKRLKAAIEMADLGDTQLLNKLGSGKQPWFTGGLAGAKLALSSAEMVQAQADSPGATAEVALSQLKDRQRAERDVASEKVRNAQGAVEYFKAELDALEKTNAGYEAQAAAIENVRAAEMNLKEVRLAEAMLGASPIAQGTANMEAQREDLRIRREASERLMNAGMGALRNQAEIAGLRGELADSPVEQAAAWDRKRAVLVQEIALLAGRNDKIKERLQLQLELRRMDDEERGRMTRGQELLHASLGGGGALEQFVNRQGGTFGLVGDNGPSLDWSRLAGSKNYRGDVLDAGSQIERGYANGLLSTMPTLEAAGYRSGVRTGEMISQAWGVG